MSRILGKLMLLLLLVMPTTIMFAGKDGPSMLVGAEDAEADVEDTIEGEDEEGDATVETDEDAEAEKPADGAVTETDKEEEEEVLKASNDADTQILFTQPKGGVEFPAGATVKFLVGFTNKGKTNFIVETMDASFRYPQDFSFYIQNFTTAKYERVVEPSRQATFEYLFTPSETFNARPFGLTINLNYKDADGKQYLDAVFNDTVQIVEADEGLDGETFFLYVFLAAVTVLLLVGAQQLLASFGKKRSSKPKQAVEMGTQGKGDVDYDWIPKEVLQNHSPGRSPKNKQTSPRNRRSKRNTGGDD